MAGIPVALATLLAAFRERYILKKKHIFNNGQEGSFLEGQMVQ